LYLACLKVAVRAFSEKEKKNFVWPSTKGTFSEMNKLCGSLLRMKTGFDFNFYGRSIAWTVSG
jgi:hypothetical protein